MQESERIAHLLRRTGFGALPEELRQARHDGFEATVVKRIRQLTSEIEVASDPPMDLAPALAIPVTLLTFARGVLWWMETMARSRSQLTEKLTVFWHRHFATSGTKVFRPGWMFAQNQTFRRSGKGRFGDLLKAMVRDPALLHWLDADNTPRSNPNENLARELLELFTLGRGHYQEQDIKALAKLTAGRRVSLINGVQERDTYEGPVDLLGRKGQQDLDSVLDRLAVHPQTAERLVGRLWDDFVAAPLPETERKRLTRVWLASRGHITVVLREILLSKHFCDAPRQRVLSPVEYLLTCSRLLSHSDFALEDLEELNTAGELLFFPPSVKGWDLGEALIHPAAFQSRLTLIHKTVSRLETKHFALQGLKRTPNPSSYLAHITGGHIRQETVAPHLAGLDNREALVLGLTSPDLWTC